MFYNVTNPGMTVEQGDILVSNYMQVYRHRSIRSFCKFVSILLFQFFSLILTCLYLFVISTEL